ncbi:MAG: flagellar filament capping protein FliD [Candidatus Zixiibacteriota bacterium]|nr:MAG: flagellar filament capping protein FliD [candidate division Zixibacteria bacterium]
MASGAIDGIFSGLNTTEIINSIIEAERAKQNVYLARQAEYTQKLTSWQTINSYLLAFKTQTDVLSRASLWDKISVTSSNSDVISVTGSGSSASGTYFVSVDQLAQNQQIASQGYSSDQTIVGTGTIEISVGGSAPITINLEAGSNSLSALKHAINDAGAGVTAAIINDGSGNNPFRLILSANETGADSEITVTNDLIGGTQPDFGTSYFDIPERIEWSPNATSNPSLGASASYTGIANKIYNFTIEGSGSKTIGVDEVAINWTDGTNSGSITIPSTFNPAVDEVVLTGDGSDGLTLSFSSGVLVGGDTFQVQALAPTIQAGQDAILRLGSQGSGGSPIVVTSSSNTVTTLIDGVTLELHDVSSDPIRIKVDTDHSSVISTIQDLVGKYNEFAKFVDEQMSFDPEANKAGILLGDTSLVNLLSYIRSDITRRVRGLDGDLTKLSDIGVKFDIYGKLGVDTSVLTELLNDDPEAVKKLFLASGNSDNGYIKFLSAGPDAVPSENGYDVDITQAATRGRYTGASIDNPALSNIDLTNNNNRIKISVNGVVSSEISLEARIYTSGDDLAAEIQEKINADEALGSNDVEVVWVDNGDTGHLEMSSSIWGSNSKVNIDIEPAWSAHSLLGFSGGLSTDGTDVEGTINGEPATGLGQILTGDDDNENTAGLKLKVTLTPDLLVDGAEGKITLTKGIAALLSERIDAYTDANDGILNSRTKTIEKQINNIKEQIERMEEQLEVKRESLYKQFIAMEEAIGKLQSQQMFLSSAIASLGSLGQTNSNSGGLLSI